MALTDNLVSYWKLDEASGNALDAHGSNNLTDTNTVGTGTGKINGGRDFESGNTEYFTIASNADLQVGDIDFTFQAWIKFESVPDAMPIVNKNTGAPPDLDYNLFISAAGEPRFTVFDSATNSYTVTWGAALSTNTWYCIHAWHDSVNNQLGLVVNAGTPQTLAHSAGVGTKSAPFRIGGTAAAAQYFDGIIDEVGFWKRVLTSQERTDLYNAGAGLSYDNFDTGGQFTLVAGTWTAGATFDDVTLTASTGGFNYTINAGIWTAGATFEDAARDYSLVGGAETWTGGATFEDATLTFSQGGTAYTLVANPWTMDSTFAPVSLFPNLSTFPTHRGNSKKHKILRRI